MKSQELKFTDTNSADDSQGRTWGLEGNLFWFLAGDGFGSVVLMLLLFSACRFTFFASAVVAAIPLALTLIYVFGFRQGKPPRYDMDYLEYWLAGRGFGPETHSKTKPPLEIRHV